jgi:hypothetical protein
LDAAKIANAPVESLDDVREELFENFDDPSFDEQEVARIEAAALAAVPEALEPAAAPALPVTRARLQSAPLRSAGFLGGNSDGAELVELEGGGKGVFKPLRAADENSLGLGEGMDDEASPPLPAAELETLSSDLSWAFGMQDLIPETVMRRGGNLPGGDAAGSLQEYLEGYVTGKQVGKEKQFGVDDRKLALAGAFDFLVFNTDRHEDNWMVHPETGDLKLIDNARIFWPMSVAQHGDGEHMLTAEAGYRGLAVPQEFKVMTDDALEAMLSAKGLPDDIVREAVVRLGILRESATFEDVDRRLSELLDKMEDEEENGGPATAPTQTLAEWFAGSKITDAEGKPRVMYRGTKGDSLSPYGGAAKSMTFLAPTDKFAKGYASQFGNEGKVHALHVRAEKPIDISSGYGYGIWKQYKEEKNPPEYAVGSTDEGMAVAWTHEREFRKWLDEKGIEYDAIYFAENDRSRSLAVKDPSQLRPTGQE